MATEFRAGTARRIADGITTLFIALHLSPKGYYLLTTIGRKSGRATTTPVILMEEGDQRWLVAPFGTVSWVHNARALGKVIVTRQGRAETVKTRELPPEQAAPILRKYVANVAVARPYFDVGIDSPDDAYITEAPKHPVFELTSLEA